MYSHLCVCICQVQHICRAASCTQGVRAGYEYCTIRMQWHAQDVDAQLPASCLLKEPAERC